MSKAIQETLKRLEQTTISEPTTAASSPSGASTVSASSSPQHQHQQRDGIAGKLLISNETVSLNTGSLDTAAPISASGADQSPNDGSSTLGRGHTPRRAIQSMYGAPPGYNATMGVGGFGVGSGRDSLGRGRVGSGRQRSSIMVPDQLQAALHPQSMVPTAPLQTPVTRLTGAEYALMANMPDDAIPNAIVVKNINFAIKREDLLQTIADLGLPLPYAFNYHFDNGVFRGLAFGNFRTPEEAARVIVGLNGLSLLGRPLKVEYKKALPGTVPPPHPNTIAMMNSAGGGAHMGGESQNDNEYNNGMISTGHLHSSSSSSNIHQLQQQQQQQQQQQHQFDRPIPRTRRNQNGDASERPRSMMVFPSTMSIPDTSSSHLQQQQQQQHQSQHQHQQQTNNSKSTSSNNDSSSSLIDLDDEGTRTLYDVVSHFRHDKSIAELEFPCSLNTKQRQTIMLIAERFGLNHETKSDANGRYIRVYKGLNTLLEGTEVRRRSVASPGSNNVLSGSVGGSQTMRYGSVSQGRSRPVSMLYPESMSMGGIGSPPTQQHSHQQHYQQQQHQQQRMNSYHQPQSYQQYHDSTRVRSFTHSQAGAMAQFNGVMQQYQQQPQPQQQQQYQATQPFPRTADNPSRTSGNYVGYPSRLYQDSVVVPSRHPRGPDMTQNFVARQQMHAQEERQAQRQVQLKVLQQIRQRRQSSAGEDGVPAPTATTTTPPPPAQIIMPSPASNGGGSSTSGASVFKIEKPGSKAIPIVRPKDEDAVADNDNEQQMASPVSSSSLAQAATDSLKVPASSTAGAAAAAGQQYQE